jgi:hypothetical protein
VPAVQARMRAWLAALLSIAADAYGIGDVRAGETLAGISDTLSVHDERGAPRLVVLWALPARNAMQALAQAGAIELWVIGAARGSARFFQITAAGRWARVNEDRNGVYFSTLHEDLYLPPAWFTEPPVLFDVMAYWHITDD